MLSKLIVASTLAVLVAGIGGTARAQTSDYRTYFTFTTPVTLPGVTLPAGRYLFRLADPNSSRKVISVLSADGKTPLAMLHTIPNQLMKAPQDPEIRFMETSGEHATGDQDLVVSGQSDRIRVHLSESAGAAACEGDIRAGADDTRRDQGCGDGGPGSNRRFGRSSPCDVEEAPAPVQATGRAQQGEVATAPSATATAAPDPRADERARSTARTQLPQTASSMPLVMLLAVLAMCAGVGLWLSARPSPRRV